MRIRLQNELLPINILAMLLIIIIAFFPSNVLRIILGLPFVLFFPGYTLSAALFPRRNTLGSIERVALSFVLSAAVVPLMGLILNYTPWGIRLYPILLSLAIFILVTSLIAWYRRRLARVEGFTFAFNLSLLPWRGQRFIDKILSVILIAVILGTIGTLGYVTATTPRVGEKFTEFYILGLEGKAIDYPSELRVGEEGRVIVGIINREHETVNYRIEVRIDGVRNNEVEPLELQPDEKWEEIVSFTPNRAGDSQKVEFVLYREGKSYFRDPPYLLVSVKE